MDTEYRKITGGNLQSRVHPIPLIFIDKLVSIKAIGPPKVLRVSGCDAVSIFYATYPYPRLKQAFASSALHSLCTIISTPAPVGLGAWRPLCNVGAPSREASVPKLNGSQRVG